MYRTLADTTIGFLSQAANPVPSITPSLSVKGPGEAVAFGGLGLLYTGLAVTSVLFTYGIAKSHSDKMVRTTGYILTSVGVLGVLGALAMTVGITAQAATRG